MQSGIVLNNRYQIIDLLAEGGMAQVYRAKDLVLDRTVALKVLREQYAADQAFLARFQQEARAAAALAHPNIVSIYDVGRASGHQYIVMELVDGPNLKLVLQREGAFGPGRAIDIILQVLAALSFAHSRGIVHRDVKPQNILLTGQNHAKVADFGIARAVANSQLTETGVVMGSVHYCAPEQAMGKGATQASDVYAAGVMLYEMLTGRLPFESDNALGIALKHVQELPPSPREINPQLSPVLEQIVLKALAKEPSQRYAGAAEMATALESYRQSGAQATMPFAAVSLQDRLPERVIAAGVLAPAPSQARRRRPVRRRTFDWLVALFGVLILALIAGFVPLAWRLNDLYGSPLSTATVSQPTATTPPSPTTTATPRMATVPRVISLTFAQAERELATQGLQVTRSDDFSDRFDVGLVISQTVSPGQQVAQDTNVGVTVSKGARMIRVPRVVNVLLDQAKRQLELLGLRVDSTSQYDDRVAQGRVIAQAPLEDTSLASGSVVSLQVSRGPQPTPQPQPRGTVQPPTPTVPTDSRVRVPKVVGLPEMDARNQIEASRLTNSYTNYQKLVDVPAASRDAFLQTPVGAVVSQNPAPDAVVVPYTTVLIAVRSQ